MIGMETTMHKDRSMLKKAEGAIGKVLLASSLIMGVAHATTFLRAQPATPHELLRPTDDIASDLRYEVKVLLSKTVENAGKAGAIAGIAALALLLEASKRG
jgi:hypothetical protein